MLRARQRYYCKTERDVDLIMQLLEKDDYRWRSGNLPRFNYQTPPIIYIIDNDAEFGCIPVPDSDEIADSIHISQIQNKIISELRRQYEEI